MSDLVNKQHKFATCVAKLISHADQLGYTITLGDAYRDPRLHGVVGVKAGYGSAKSCHKVRLAIDINIIRDGKIADEKYYAILHDYWDKIGGAPRIANDLNHFSFSHEGMR